jgi:6-pyruvoyltetrahydropterin/6-carboxytetrahydropterin synthase
MWNETEGTFYVRIEGRFESAHYLYKYFPDGTDEPIHGHSWKVEVSLASRENIGKDGISYDFLAARTRLNELVASIDHILINDHPDFQGINPTSENVARWFFAGLKNTVRESNGKIVKIVIHEGPENLAYFEPSASS